MYLLLDHVLSLRLLIVFCIFFHLPSSVIAADNYWIRVKPAVTGPFTVDVSVETNIPGQPVLSGSLALKGLKPQDTFIGTDFIHIPIVNGKGNDSIDALKKGYPIGLRLPAGTYNVEVTFHPRWKENKESASKAGIREPIEGRATVKLSGSGISIESTKKVMEGRKWVRHNVQTGTQWDSQLWQTKFGKWQEVEYKGDGNPNVFKLYYFKSIDMTILVNNRQGEIITYREGISEK